MKFVYFTHSLASCWNHGNAHFLRGVIRELSAAGHDVAVYEPEGSWSLSNLLADAGEDALAAYEAAYPELKSQTYSADIDLSRATDSADVVIVHEWNEQWLVAALGQLRKKRSAFQLLFHDTHHRAVSDPAAMRVRSAVSAVMVLNVAAMARSSEGGTNKAAPSHNSRKVGMSARTSAQPACAASSTASPNGS